MGLYGPFLIGFCTLHYHHIILQDINTHIQSSRSSPVPSVAHETMPLYASEFEAQLFTVHINRSTVLFLLSCLSNGDATMEPSAEAEAGVSI